MFNHNVSFGLALNTVDKESIYDLRVNNYLGKFDYLLSNDRETSPGKDIYDERSYLFYLKENNKIIGTSRLTPKIEGMWPVPSEICKVVESMDEMKYIYFNRVLIDSKYRNHDFHELIFFYFSQWLINNTSYKMYFSLCQRPLIKLYSKYGARKVIDSSFLISSRQNKEYYLIEGDLNETNLILQTILNRKKINILNNK